jgi:hypothetical protein
MENLEDELEFNQKLANMTINDLPVEVCNQLLVINWK